MFNYAALERRIAALESNRGASLRFGTVTESDPETGAARVQLEDGDGMVSYPLRVLQERTLKDQRQVMPDIGEPVAALFSGQGMEQGVVLGACYSTKTPPPAMPQGHDYMVYEDGTELWYDREKHKLIAKVKGDIEAEVEGNVQAEVEGNITATVKGNVTATVKKDVLVEAEGSITATAQKEILAESAINITLRAPTITLAGLLRVTDKFGKAGSGELLGHYKILGGGLDVPDDNVTTGKTLVAGDDAVINGIAFVPHEHGNVMPGGGTTGPPVGG